MSDNEKFMFFLLLTLIAACVSILAFGYCLRSGIIVEKLIAIQQAVTP